jgi:hypothetical protein
MLDVFGETYHLNLDNIDSFVNLPTETVSGETEVQHISVLKYEMVKLLLDVVLTESEEVDDKLGMKGSNNLTLPFKLAWNTMLKNKFIEKF